MASFLANNGDGGSADLENIWFGIDDPYANRKARRKVDPVEGAINRRETAGNGSVLREHRASDTVDNAVEAPVAISGRGAYSAGRPLRTPS